jgi:hypothetical protein
MVAIVGNQAVKFGPNHVRPGGGISMRAPLIAAAPLAAERPELTNFRFGIVRELSELLRKYKSTDFRWGIGFDNPRCKPIEWYEVVHLPAELNP